MAKLAEWADGNDFDQKAFQDAMSEMPLHYYYFPTAGTRANSDERAGARLKHYRRRFQMLCRYAPRELLNRHGRRNVLCGLEVCTKHLSRARDRFAPIR